MDQEKHSSGVMEVIAIAALLLLIWKYVHKKGLFNVNLKPLTTDDENLGDNYIDESKGYGDDYAGKQADAYNEMKASESDYIARKSVVQFRLINSGSSRITTNLLNSTQDPNIINGSYDSGTIIAPVAAAASGMTEVAFDANWAMVGSAIGYLLDVATDSLFLSLVPGYNNLDVNNVLTYHITGLSAATQYFYRVRAYDSINTSASSNTISAYTQFNHYFLPSQDELKDMYTNLHAFGMGGFTAGLYYSSTENSATAATAIDFTNGLSNTDSKALARRVRACRLFITASGAYPLRSMGPAGGLIFIVIDNGNGTDTCYEAAPADQSASTPWSNVTGTLIGTTGAIIGTGIANTAAIIGQAGHTSSAAKLCNDLIV